MEGKKFSFGFSKTAKKPALASLKVPEEKVQLIECLEGQSIKIKNFVEEVKSPLVIPVKESKKASIAYQLKQKNLDENEDSVKESKAESELTLDELAARELINEAQNRLKNNTTETKLTQLPITPDSVPLDGEKEPTLDDYESVPISEYGLAMLRGMGWKEGMSIGKNTSTKAVLAAPELRPKGLGLGATKVVQSETPKNKVMDKDGKELKIVKGAFAKVIAGAQKGNYCEVKGYDNEEGRVIVQIFPKGTLSNINELLLTPVTKEEFSKGSKVLNNAKYDEYKEQSDIKLENFRVKQEKHEDSLIIEIKDEEDSNSDDDDHYRSSKKSRSSPKNISKNGRDSVAISKRYEDNKYRSKAKSRKTVSDRSSEERESRYSKNMTEERSEDRHSSKKKSKYRKSSQESRKSRRSLSPEERKKSKSRKKSRDRSESEEREKRKAKAKSDRYEKEQREHRKKKKSKSRPRKSSTSSESSSDD